MTGHAGFWRARVLRRGWISSDGLCVHGAPTTFEPQAPRACTPNAVLECHYRMPTGFQHRDRRLDLVLPGVEASDLPCGHGVSIAGGKR